MCSANANHVIQNSCTDNLLLINRNFSDDNNEEIEKDIAEKKNSQSFRVSAFLHMSLDSVSHHCI